MPEVWSKKPFSKEVRIGVWTNERQCTIPYYVFVIRTGGCIRFLLIFYSQSINAFHTFHQYNSLFAMQLANVQVVRKRMKDRYSPMNYFMQLSLWQS